MQQQTEMPRLKFTDAYVDRVLDGEKTATIRVGLENEQTPVLDRPLGLTTTAGQLFGTGIVTQVERTTARKAVERDVDGHRSYECVSDLLAELRRYYPDADLDESTLVTIIYWNQLQEVTESPCSN